MAYPWLNVTSWRYGPIQKLTHDFWTILLSLKILPHHGRQMRGCRLISLPTPAGCNLFSNFFAPFLMHYLRKRFMANCESVLSRLEPLVLPIVLRKIAHCQWTNKTIFTMGNIMSKGMPNTKPYISNKNCTCWSWRGPHSLHSLWRPGTKL